MQRRVLLIDYDPRSVERIRGLCARHGVAVEALHDGTTAGRDFERIRPDLVLVQDLLPHKHGFEVCRELKTSVLGRYVPVVLITGIRDGREWELRNTECDGYVKRPFSDDALIAQIRKFLPQPELARRVARPEIPVQFSEEEVLARLDQVLGDWGPQQPVAEPETAPKPELAPQPRPVRRRGKRTLRGGSRQAAKTDRAAAEPRTRNRRGSKRKTTMKAAVRT